MILSLFCEVVMAKTKLIYSKKEIENLLSSGLMFCGMFRIKARNLPFHENVYIWNFGDRIELHYEDVVVKLDKNTSYKEMRTVAKEMLKFERGHYYELFRS